MSTVEENIAKLAANSARMDERTIAILANQEDIRIRLEEHNERQKTHEKDDRVSFAVVDERLTKVEGNQRWFLRLGAFVGTSILALMAFVLNRGGDI